MSLLKALLQLWTDWRRSPVFLLHLLRQHILEMLSVISSFHFMSLILTVVHFRNISCCSFSNQKDQRSTEWSLGVQDWILPVLR